MGTATVTLEGETIRFGETSFPALRCDPDLFGVFWVILGEVDEQGEEVPNGGGFSLIVLGEGTDSASVGQVPMAQLTLPARDQIWIADPEEIELSNLEPGTSQIDEYTIDGNRVTGSATFFDRETWFAYSAANAEDFLVAEATFEVTCG